MPDSYIMPDADAVKRLLSGEINPTEIEDDVSLYSMAERIYGSEALEEMGVSAPEIGAVELPPQSAPISTDVSLPDFVPDMSDSKENEISERGGRRYFVLFTGLFGLIGVAVNSLIGGGQVLCSMGVADYPYICNPDYGNYKLVLEEGYTWERLHTEVAWTQPMDLGIFDIGLLAVFSIITLIGFLFRKKSVHSGDVLPLSS